MLAGNDMGREGKGKGKMGVSESSWSPPPGELIAVKGGAEEVTVFRGVAADELLLLQCTNLYPCPCGRPYLNPVDHEEKTERPESVMGAW